MSFPTNPLNFTSEGDVNVTPPCQGSVSIYGYGDLNVNRRGTFYGTENSVSPTTGSLIVYGGLGISLDSQFGGDINVLYGTSYLTSTIIDTTNGLVSVTGGNCVSIAVGNSSQFTVTGGTLTLSAQSNNVFLTSGLNSGAAVQITATNPAGGVQILSGSGLGGVSLIAGSGGISGFTSSGNVSLICNNGSTSLINNSLSSSQNINVELYGQTDSQISVISSGINQTLSALVLGTSNTSGNISINNCNGSGSGGVFIATGTGGFNVTTNTSGPINIVSQAGNMNFLLNSSIPGQTLTIGVNNTTNSLLLLTSSGTGTALEITSINTGGSILISQAANSLGAINVLAGRGGFNCSTQTGGSINILTYGAASQFTNLTTATGQDLTLSVNGGTTSRLVLACDGTTTDAVNINSSGGIYGYSNGPINFESQTLIQLGTNVQGVPIQIGTNLSTTTVFGNLDVKGTQTSIESVVTTFTDNIIVVNSAPSGTANGGVGIKRWQPANNSSLGDVIQDTPDETGNLQSANTAISVTLPFSSNTSDNFYTDYWILITAGTGAGQARKIKSYTGATRVALIYTTADQTDPNVLNGVEPIEGLNFLTTPDATSVYALFACNYEFMIWNEFTNEFEFGCAPNTSSNALNHYANVQVNNLTATNVNTGSINGSTADIVVTVTLTNNSTSPVTIPGIGTYGIYLVMVSPAVSTGTYAIFTLANNSSNSSCGGVNRISCTKGVNGEMVDISWSSGSSPQLLYRPSKGISGTSQYILKIITV